MHFSSILPGLYGAFGIDTEDIQALEEISARQIELEGRILPNDERINIVCIQ